MLAPVGYQREVVMDNWRKWIIGVKPIPSWKFKMLVTNNENNRLIERAVVNMKVCLPDKHADFDIGIFF